MTTITAAHASLLFLSAMDSAVSTDARLTTMMGAMSANIHSNSLPTTTILARSAIATPTRMEFV